MSEGGGGEEKGRGEGREERWRGELCHILALGPLPVAFPTPGDLFRERSQLCAWVVSHSIVSNSLRPYGL